MEEKELVKKEKHGGKFFAIGVLLVAIVFGGVFVWGEYKEKQKLNQDFVSQEPTLPAIDQKTFEELPVGVIYEVPEELQNQYLEYAKAKYEAYKHLGPQQTDSGEVYQVQNYLEKREDVVGRYNEKPSDMLNDDMSLRYPDMFYGFIIHDESITGDNEEDVLEAQDKTYFSKKMNQILFVEDYYLNGGKITSNIDSFEWKYSGDMNSCQYDYPQITNLFQRAVTSNFFESDKKQGVVKTLFSYMFAPTNLDYDFYDTAQRFMSVQNNEYFHQADYIKGFPEKYNDVDNWEDTYPVYFYPTKIWKIDDNTIIVDICVENGDLMNFDDMNEIITKLNQANLTKATENHGVYDYEEIDDSNAYMVFGRFFNSDVTQGFMPDFGVQILNYKAINGWENGSSFTAGVQRYGYVLNDKAKNFLRDFYKELQSQLDNKKTPSTSATLKKVANEHKISYNDGMEIYITHYGMASTYGLNLGATVNW